MLQVRMQRLLLRRWLMGFWRSGGENSAHFKVDGTTPGGGHRSGGGAEPACTSKRGGREWTAPSAAHRDQHRGGATTEREIGTVVARVMGGGVRVRRVTTKAPLKAPRGAGTPALALSGDDPFLGSTYLRTCKVHYPSPVTFAFDFGAHRLSKNRHHGRSRA